MKIKTLKNNGICVSKATFHTAVNNADNSPENNFDVNSNNLSRRVDMWYTPVGLLCHHKGKYFITPLANIVYANLVEDADGESSDA